MADEKKNPLGPTGNRLCIQLKRLRESRGLSYKQLSDRLKDLGRPIPTLGLSRIEKGERRVDVDDLVALALALDVTPNRLLLEEGATTEHGLQLTPEIAAPTVDSAWRWACGEYYLFPLDAPTPVGDVLRFMAANRPHANGSASVLEAEIAERGDTLTPIAHVVRAAQRQGVSLQTVIDYLRLTDALDSPPPDVKG